VDQKVDPVFDSLLEALRGRLGELLGSLGTLLRDLVLHIYCKKQYETHIFKNRVFFDLRCLGPVLGAILVHFGQFWSPKTGSKLVKQTIEKVSKKCLLLDAILGAILGFKMGSKITYFAVSELSCGKEAPGEVQGAPRQPKESPGMDLGSPKGVQESPGIAPGSSKGGSRESQEDPEPARESPRQAQDGRKMATRLPQGSPRQAQGAASGPKESQESPRRT